MFWRLTAFERLSEGLGNGAGVSQLNGGDGHAAGAQRLHVGSCQLSGNPQTGLEVVDEPSGPVLAEDISLDENIILAFPGQCYSPVGFQFFGHLDYLLLVFLHFRQTHRA